MSNKEITKETAFKAIEKLVDRFTEHYESYKNQNYNETQTRIDFINPFFIALGWDMNNEQGYAECYREVIHEDKVKVGEAVKAPDYCFTIQGQKKLFYLEAKKPSISIKDDVHPAYQVRRYGWSAKLPISVVTDFEELAVYDTSIKPSPKDNATVARIKYTTYDKYLTDFDFIWDTFSKEKVLKGSFDKYVKSDAQKRGTSSVDKEFLKSLDSWRELLAKKIVYCNKKDNLNDELVNYAVQLIIDRIIFLRICEDRCVEPYEKLKKIGDRKNAYQELINYFYEADDKYNSGLFRLRVNKKDIHTPVDDLTPNLYLEDKTIKDIITELYYPESPYQFSEIPVEILGHAYEQFLGKVIRLTTGGMCKIEEKPEVRKAGGVYYTPQYIVEYIVKNTVGKLIDGKTPKEIEKIKIVDPACGSGSFLLGAYQHLLDYHLNYYNESKNRKNTKELTPDGQLSTSIKKKILLNNIFGVDLDAQAVEVTKLSLLLKTMDGETEGSIKHQMSLFHERVLPTLDNNVRCGNSLVGVDFYDEKFDFDDETIRRKIKPFNWETAFPEIFQKGGFNVVIGNPPYIFARGGNFEEGIKNYYNAKFSLSNYQINTYLLFTEKAYSLLSKNGFMGFIVPNNWLTIDTFSSLRKFLLEKTCDLSIVNNYDKVFQDANIDTCILSFSKGKPNTISLYECTNKTINDVGQFKPSTFYGNNYIINIAGSKEESINDLIVKINNNSVSLQNFAVISTGLKAYQTGKGKPVQTDKIKQARAFHSKEKLDKDYKRYLEGKDVSRYLLKWSGEYLSYGDWLAEPRKSVPFTGSRILVRQIPSQPPYSINAVYTEEEFLNDINSMVIFNFKENPLFILAILNSKLTTYWFINTLDKLQRKTFPQFKVKELSIFPIIKSCNSDKKNEIICYSEKIMELKIKVFRSKSQQEKQQIQAQIDYNDQKIDILVYELYGFKKEEIKTVEDSLK